MINTALQAEAKALAEKRAEFKTWLDGTKAADGTYALDGQGIEEFHKRNAELDESTKSYENKLAVARAEAKNEDELKALNAPINRVGGEIAPRSAGRDFAESAAYKAMLAGGEVQPVSVKVQSPEFKTLMATGAGYAPANPRTNIVVLSAQRRPVVGDLIPQDFTDLSVIKYMSESTFTNAAATAAEGATFAESALAYTEVSSLVRKIATTLPVTDEQLKFVPSVATLIDGRLVLMMKLSEENQLLSGNGTAPNLQGFLGASGVQAALKTAVDGDNNADAIFRMFQAIRTNAYADPSGVVINPANWTPIRLLKSTQGNYLYGDPSEAGPERIFGVPVVQTMAITAGTCLTGDFGLYSHISRAGEIEVSVGYVNAQFASGQKTLRATEYLSLEIYRGAAFGKVTVLD